jgi:hypothetical protein
VRTELLQVLLFKGGPRITTLLELNIGGPSATTLRNGLRKPRLPLSCIARSTVAAVVNMYSTFMKEKGISPGKVICQAAEDETAIVAEVRWSQREDALIGFCGQVGADHKCDHCGVVVKLVGGQDGRSVYQQIVHAFEKYRVGWYGRLIMINPLSLELPSLAVMFQATCNKFDADTFVRPQWDELAALWAELGGLERVGMLIGHTSDGDARRRKLMQEDMTRELDARLRFTLPNCPGFTLVAKSGENDVVSGLHSQDPIHNGKKGINPLDSACRRLVLGNHLATIQHLHAVYAAYDYHEHGMQLTDIERKDRQNWAACQRLMFRKARKCLDALAVSEEHRYLKTQGTSAYLEVSESVWLCNTYGFRLFIWWASGHHVWLSIRWLACL